jgi:hypothetical protein
MLCINGQTSALSPLSFSAFLTALHWQQFEVLVVSENDFTACSSSGIGVGSRKQREEEEEEEASSVITEKQQ